MILHIQLLLLTKFSFLARKIHHLKEFPDLTASTKQATPQMDSSTGGGHHAVTATNIHLVVDVDGSSNLPVTTCHRFQPLAIMVTSSCIRVLVVELQSTLRQQSLSWGGKPGKKVVTKTRHEKGRREQLTPESKDTVDETGLFISISYMHPTHEHNILVVGSTMFNHQRPMTSANQH